MVHIGERDITWSASHIYIVLEHEKGRSRREDPRARTLVFPVQPSLQPLIDVLEKWRVCRMTWGHSTLFFALKGETLHKSPHVPMTAWLLNVCARLDEQPPPGYAWSSHSLRKGGASAASAIGVPLSTIRHIGGWAVASSVVNQYIDPAVLASAGAWFFVWCIFPHISSPRVKISFLMSCFSWHIELTTHLIMFTLEIVGVIYPVSSPNSGVWTGLDHGPDQWVRTHGPRVRGCMAPDIGQILWHAYACHKICMHAYACMA